MKKEETAIHLFNKALKTLYLFNIEASKQNAKELCLVQLEVIKETLYNVFEPNKDDIKKILDELQGSAWSKSESRFVESMPAEITITDNSVFLRRHVEIRRGACLKTKKSVIIDGLEYSREANEIRWSSWYPAGIEEICLSIYEKENIIVS